MSNTLRLLLKFYLTDLEFWLQVLLFVLLALLALAIARRLKMVQWRLPGWTWQEEVGLFYFPLLGLIGGRLIAELLRRTAYEFPIFIRLTDLFWIMLVYRTALNLVRYFDPEDAPMIRRRILIPLAVLAAMLRLGGQLGGFLSLLNKVTLFTIGEGEQAFTLSLSLLLFGPLTLVLLHVATQGLRTLLVQDILPNIGLDESRSYATGTILGYMLLFVGILFVLTALEIDLTTMAVVGSALAVGIGFGLQNTVNNFVSGFLVMFDPALNVGDLIEVSNERGHIRRVGIRNTTIEALDGTQVIMPNATLSSSPVLNLSHSNRPRKVSLTVPVSLDADPQQVEEALLTILREHPNVLDGPGPVVTLQRFSQGAMHFQLTFWTNDMATTGSTTDEVNLAIWRRMRTMEAELAPVAGSGQRIGATDGNGLRR